MNTSLATLLKNRLIAAGAVAVAVIAIVTTIGMMDEYRFWVLSSEFKIVAGRVYELTIPEQRRVISGIERQLDRARAIPPPEREIPDDVRINDLEQDLQEEQDTLMKQIDERARFAK